MQRIELGERDGQAGPISYQFEQWLDQPSLVHAVFTRHGGTSGAPWNSLNFGGTVGDDPQAVERNIRIAFDSLALDGANACTVWQIHSADVIMAEAPVPGRRWLARADGMITNRGGMPLLMRFADCVPVLFYDPAHQAIGIAHAGWRGTVNQVVVSTLRAMQDAFGSQPAEIEAGIGPSIGPDRYQVGPEVVEAVAQAFGTTQDLIRYADDGSTYLNLWEANRLALERAGVRKIEVSGLCTASNLDDFYSHRAEHGKTGRFAAIISLKAGKQAA